MAQFRIAGRPSLVTMVITLATAKAEVMPKGSHALGAGSLSCSAWTAARQAGNAVEDGAWVLGFLSGIGSAWIGQAETVDPLNDMTVDGVFNWLDSYCGAQPADLIAKAALAFVRAHQGGTRQIPVRAVGPALRVSQPVRAHLTSGSI
jgi:hypothetical protein